MSDELKDFDEQLRTVIAEIQKIIDVEIPKAKGKTKIDKCDFAKNRLNRAKQLLKSYNVELRELPRADARPFEEKAKDFEALIQKLSDDINWAATSAERDDLIGNKPRNADEMTAKELVEHGKAVQEQSKASTTRAKEVLQHTIEIGNNTTETLKQQTEQLSKVDQNLDLIESNLKRADKQIRIFLRRMASDKVVLSLIVLVVLGIIGAVVTYYVMQKRKPNTNDLKGNLNLQNNLPNITLF